jgi:hypothetical protein
VRHGLGAERLHLLCSIDKISIMAVSLYRLVALGGRFIASQQLGQCILSQALGLLVWGLVSFEDQYYEFRLQQEWGDWA